MLTPISNIMFDIVVLDCDQKLIIIYRYRFNIILFDNNDRGPQYRG